ncbi:hypothetical protein DQ237_02225 [Blastococcus sp. TF02-8]|uniref:dihydrodipicolinate synthase family protein n=1 Tax=Blastococcus sp. TF02-8 TaxID=2250574 RepID=UPI000DEBD5F2|nr:dihydrodipicolinate synthase family protein [Blastococcus sp. TF02-8]RBY97754.1 hypothetical protein DQ237_02225 [Blastococcus sp. TF02-8]
MREWSACRACAAAAAHLATERFVEVARAFDGNDVARAREVWRTVAPMVPTLFAESNPMPLKYCLWRLGLIRSPECRLPLTQVSSGMAATLESLVAGLPER